MGKAVLALIAVFCLGCEGDPWEHRLACRGLVESAKQCREYKTLAEALDGVSDEFERKKITALYKLFGPTPAPMCKGLVEETWGWWKRRKAAACEKFLEEFPPKS